MKSLQYIRTYFARSMFREVHIFGTEDVPGVLRACLSLSFRFPLFRCTNILFASVLLYGYIFLFVVFFGSRHVGACALTIGCIMTFIVCE